MKTGTIKKTTESKGINKRYEKTNGSNRGEGKERDQSRNMYYILEIWNIRSIEVKEGELVKEMR